MTDENIFTLDGNSYKEEDLDNKQKYLKNQINKIYKLNQLNLDFN